MQNKVLYIGNYNDNTGWGNAVKNNILAMDMAGIDVVPRSITYNDSKFCDNPIISRLELKDKNNCNICIQHTLPIQYSYHGGMKNIGYCELETLDIKHSNWNTYMSLMDEIWVPNQGSMRACINAGIKCPIKLIPHCIDINEIQNHKNVLRIKELENSFNFFFVGEFIERKNIAALLEAYYLAFRQDLENVNLFLKLSGPTSDIGQNIEIYKQLDNYVKAKLGLKNYNNVTVLFDRLDRDALLSVMNRCHVFVCTSYGESCCIPAMEAMALGKYCIWTKGIGMDDYAYGAAVPSTIVPCNNIGAQALGIYNGNDRWMQIDICSLISTMQYAKKFNHDPNQSIEKIKKYDMNVIGALIKEKLDA